MVEMRGQNGLTHINKASHLLFAIRLAVIIIHINYISLFFKKESQPQSILRLVLFPFIVQMLFASFHCRSF